jgi:outer membrane protein assembly factor BamE (lipoprotein component of BamABCDE complex)
MIRYLLIALLFCSLGSCIVQSPKYAGVEKVMQLRPGMTRAAIDDSIGAPYDLRYYSDTATEYIYKYRTIERKTLSLFTRETNGVRTRGKYVDLFITYDKNGTATEIHSCSECGETKVTETKVSYNAILQFLAATAPGVLIYFGLKTDN